MLKYINNEHMDVTKWVAVGVFGMHVCVFLLSPLNKPHPDNMLSYRSLLTCFFSSAILKMCSGHMDPPHDEDIRLNT